jgi:hypothetical protein
MFWIYLRICSLSDCHTLPHRRTAAHCRAHCRTLSHTATLPHVAVRFAANCRTLLHTARIRMPHTAHSILHTAHSRTPQSTWIQTNVCERIWIYLNIHMIFKLSNLFQIYMNMFWIYLKMCSLPNCRTLPPSWAAAHCHMHCRTAAYCRAHCRTAGHSRALCRIQPHTAWVWMPESRTPHTAYCTLHTVAHRN